MLTYIENGTQFTCDFGDINVAYYNGLESVLGKMTELLLKEQPALYPQFQERIIQLGVYADRIGWGYGEALREHVRMLEAELA